VFAKNTHFKVTLCFIMQSIAISIQSLESRF
jgi:hypothetical protein